MRYAIWNPSKWLHAGEVLGIHIMQRKHLQALLLTLLTRSTMKISVFYDITPFIPFKVLITTVVRSSNPTRFIIFTERQINGSL
jgi:hypothetical protein